MLECAICGEAGTDRKCWKNKLALQWEQSEKNILHYHRFNIINIVELLTSAYEYQSCKLKISFIDQIEPRFGMLPPP